MKKGANKQWVIPLLLIIICLGVGYHFRYEFKMLFQSFQRVYQEEERQDEWPDFAYWQARNPDVYAWIRIADTKIDYPMLQSQEDTEDGYYLTHDIERDSNIYGAVYTEKANAKDFSSPNTIVYGHNMIDDSMFGTLGDFLDPAYFAKHDKIFIFTPEEKYIYQIVAAYEYPADHILSSFDFTTEAETKAYLEQIPTFVQNTNGNLRVDIKLKAPLLTLSTCTPDDAGMRCLVQAVLMTREVP